MLAGPLPCTEVSAAATSFRNGSRAPYSVCMGFNGEVLVGRGETFAGALNQFWNWEEEVLAT